MEFFLPLYIHVDAPVKPLVVKSLDFGFLQKVIDLLPLLVRQNLVLLQNNSPVPDGRPFAVINADFASIIQYVSYGSNVKVFTVNPRTELYGLTAHVIDESTDLGLIRMALQSQQSFTPEPMRSFVESLGPGGVSPRVLVVSGKTATELVVRTLPTPEYMLLVTDLYTAVGLSGSLDIRPHHRLVNIRVGSSLDLATFFNGLLPLITNRQRWYNIVISIGDAPPGLPMRVAGLAFYLSDKDWAPPEVAGLSGGVTIAYPSEVAASMFREPIPQAYQHLCAKVK